METNELGQPVGDAVQGWAVREQPSVEVLVGRYCTVERLDALRHAEDLFSADRHDRRGESWTYLPYGPFADFASYRRWVERVAADVDPQFYAVVDTDAAAGTSGVGQAVGVLSLMRVDPEVGSIEVGHVHYSPLLQRRRAATEAHYLLMRYVFDDLGYRRYEWKCDALNAPSRAAAERLGFTYEGTFRQSSVVKGRNRDTAWYSLIDVEWPQLSDRLQSWLAPDNFDDAGRQKSSLQLPDPSR
jgi:RimJ/RimL family protein N-acetyltransferase